MGRGTMITKIKTVYLIFACIKLGQAAKITHGTIEAMKDDE
jgi:hypothetical protein